MRERLEALGMADAWRVAEPLALAGLDEDWLSQMQALAGPATAAAVRSVAASLNAQRLVGELRDATERMSSLIGAVKAYAYMDRGGVVTDDVHEGLETTLTVLAHKLKHTQIEIRREDERTLPPLTTGRRSIRCGRTCSTTRSMRSGRAARSRSGPGATAKASSSTSPTPGPASRPRLAPTCSSPSSRRRRSAAAPGSDWIPPGGSSKSSTAAR